MKPFLLSIALVAWCVSCLGCSRNAQGHIVVHVFRDRSAAEINDALLAAGKMQLALADKPIVIATVEYASYSEALADLGQRTTRPEVIFFNSVADGNRLNIDLTPQDALKISGKMYYVRIPPWTTGEEHQAAEVVLASLRQELRRMEQ